jgi:hypothetical protein
MKRPLISSQMTHGVPAQAKTFADPHARGAHQKKGVCKEVISVSQLVVEKLIDFRRDGLWKI